MAPRGIRAKFREWLPGLKDEIHFTPNAPLYRAGPGTFFNHAEDFTITPSPFMAGIQKNLYTVQGDRKIVTQIMSLLSQHVIPGAAHDSSARTPPPRCHPGTRIKLLARITAWFEGQEIRELLLWITGPAGVGKSAVVQTFAEYLVKSKSLGASVFISRPNKRDNPHGIFITIGYQLATRIEAYRNYIVERLSLDPGLLKGGMEAQFATFIIEPFVEKRIGAGGRWCILLDGLDELQGEDAQCSVIRLISNFMLEHHDSPLVWIISSRPESCISSTFGGDEVRGRHWVEYIPIDSTEAYQNVEHFLRSSFEQVQKQFRRSISRDWPSNTDFLKLAVASSGNLLQAQTMMQFVADPDYCDPVSRLQALLLTIDRSDATSMEENHLVLPLDAEYDQMLSSVPSTLWPTAKRLLALTVHAEQFEWDFPGYFKTLRGMSVLLGIPQHVIYACLIKCQSTLRLPDWKVAHKENLTCRNTSFANYLKDSSKSREFYVGDLKDVEQSVQLRVLEVWNECSGDNVVPASIRSIWDQYCSKLSEETPSRDIAEIHAQVFRHVVIFVQYQLYRIFEMTAESSETPLMYAQLCRVNMINLFYCFDASDLVYFTYRLKLCVSRFNNTAFYRPIELKHLQLGHLNWEEMTPACAYYGETGQIFKGEDWILLRPRSSTELRVFMSGLESLRESSPELQVFIIGSAPKGRVAVFTEYGDPFRYYAIPYPE